jgi:hypothetical protein
LLVQSHGSQPQNLASSLMEPFTTAHIRVWGWTFRNGDGSLSKPTAPGHLFLYSCVCGHQGHDKVHGAAANWSHKHPTCPYHARTQCQSAATCKVC